MPEILIPHKHKRRPPGRITVNPDSPLVVAGNVISVVTPGIGIWRPNGVGGVIALNDARVDTRYGELHYANKSSSNDGFRSNLFFDDISGKTRLSVYCLCDLTSGALFGRWSRNGGATAGSGFLITETGGNIGAVVSGQESTTGLWSGRMSAIPLGRISMGFSWGGENNFQLYSKGFKASQSSWFGGTPSSIPTVDAYMYANRHESADSGAASTSLALGIIGDAEWGADIQKEFDKNPWQIFRADPISIYSFPSGAITLTSLTMSNFTSSGARATLSITR